MEEIKLAYYSDQCLRSGERCYDEDMIERENHDLMIFIINRKNLYEKREYAREQIKIVNKLIKKGINESFRKKLFNNLLEDLEYAEIELYN